METQGLKNKLTKSFRELRKMGYFARQNFKCCQSCGCSAIPEELKDKYIFYHYQDNGDLLRHGECYLAWSGNGEQIVKILKQNDVIVEWDGSQDTRILVKAK
jgi:hypothetical protein